MKNIVSILLIFLCLFFSELNAANSEKKKLSVALMDSIVKVKLQGQQYNALVAIIQEVARQSHIEIDIKPMPLKRILAKLEQGSVDIAVGLYKRAEREKYAVYLDHAIGQVQVGIFYQANIKHKKFSFNDLKRYQIGVLAGASQGWQFEQARANDSIKLTAIRDYETLAKMLHKQRFDLVVAARGAFRLALKNTSLLTKTSMLPFPSQANFDMYILISKTSRIADKEKLIKQMNTVVKKMRESNKLAAYYRR